jgi:cephalosporin-C deacetylase-like acetyl esterase
MTRRQLLGTPFLLPALQAQTRYREYARCVPDYFAALAADAYSRRNTRLARLTTPKAIRDYQAWARQTFIELAGGLPERTPLNLRTVGSFDRPAWRVEKLVYESRPGFFVTANLYIPKNGAPPYPGVLFHQGHSLDGKASPLYQRCCQGLAQLGYVVLSFDTMGQGERTNYPVPGGWLTRLGSADREHTVPGRQLLLVGETAAGIQLWDAIRSLDVLAARPEVDPKRLASTGQSGGATLTMMLAAVDDRLACAAVSSGNTENVATITFHSPGATDDAEQDFVGAGPRAFDRWDLLYPFAPRPLLISVSARDFFGTYSPSYAENGREEFANLAKIYPPENLKLVDTPLPHGLSYGLRVEIYKWFERHLKKAPRVIDEEPPTAPETPESLWCGPTGNTVRDFHGKTPWIIARDRARATRTPDELPDLRALLSMDPAPSTPPRLTVVGKTSYRDCEIQAVEVESAPQVWCPAWLFLPKKPWTRLVLVLEPNGRNGRWREGDLYDQIASAGVAVCAADLRGIGDLQPQFSPGAPSYTRSHQEEEDYAWSGLILGRGLLGQRVTDILAFVEALPREAAITIAARDKMTVPALCAAALDKRIASLYLSRPLPSWRSLVESETYSHPFANFVPNVLRFTDLPQIARAVAPRPVTTGDDWDVAVLSKAHTR